MIIMRVGDTIGVDVGGTKILGVVLDANGVVRHEVRAPTPRPTTSCSARSPRGDRRAGRAHHRTACRRWSARSGRCQRGAALRPEPAGHHRPGRAGRAPRPGSPARSIQGGQRRQLRGLGRTGARRRPGIRRRADGHPRHRHRWRHRRQGPPAGRGQWLRRRVRAHGDRSAWASLPVWTARLLGALRIGQRARPAGTGGGRSRRRAPTGGAGRRRSRGGTGST